MDMQVMITIGLKFVGYVIAAIGLYLYSYGEVLPRNLFIAICFLLNVLLHVPSFYITITRTGMDTTAYLNQAGQWIAGQTDYRKLITRQGPCYYPAGHLWFYSIWYHVYVHTDNAEYYLKLFHVLLHSMANSILALLAYNYYGKNDRVMP